VAKEREELLAIVTAHRQDFQEMGVNSLDVLGWQARNEADCDINLNVLAKFEQPCGLFQFFRVKHYLEDILGCPVNLGTEKAERAYLQSPVLQEALRSF
jgi:predicted nucleotidyltransferase